MRHHYDGRVEGVRATPAVGEVEQPAPDDEDSDAVDDVAQVAMVGLGQPDRRSDARVCARELE
jgi:hypothetical protein